jgi:hypothetical protein
MEYTETTYRSIAKSMASHSGAVEEEYGLQVEQTLQAIMELPQCDQYALKSAYVFSRKVPKEEREDLFQELFLNLYKSKAQDEKLCYAIARCDWKDWWKKYKVRSHYSLDESVSENESGNAETIGDLLVNEIRFETMVDGKLDAEYLWNKLPASVKPIITKRLQSKALTSNERVTLHRFVHGQGTSMLLQS